MSAASTFAVALEREILPGSLVRARLLERGILIWRGDDDAIRVWEDRCPHRSVRLSAGRNLGHCVECVYHGWRFGKDGTVIAIPACGNAARPDIRVAVLGSAVRGGFVWASLEGTANPPPSFEPADSEAHVRPLPFRANAARVEQALAGLAGVRVVVTPTGMQASSVFGYATVEPAERAIDAARRVNELLTRLRRRIEAEAAR